MALVYAIGVATFPDERMYLATDVLHGKSYFDESSGRVLLAGGPNWYEWVAPVNTLDLHGQDLIEVNKLEDIKKKNESRAVAQRQVAALTLEAGRDLTGADLHGADVRHVD